MIFIFFPQEHGESEENKIKEQQKYGILFEDDYDYMQHLRAPETAVLEPVMREASGAEGRTTKEDKVSWSKWRVSADVADYVTDCVFVYFLIKVHLPASVFGAEVTVEGQLDRVLPITGEDGILKELLAN